MKAVFSFLIPFLLVLALMTTLFGIEDYNFERQLTKALNTVEFPSVVEEIERINDVVNDVDFSQGNFFDQMVNGLKVLINYIALPINLLVILIEDFFAGFRFCFILIGLY